jgi:hypothetical protein
MKKSLFLFACVAACTTAQAQFFQLKKSYTGYHFAFSRFNPDDINRFVVQFNQRYANDISSGFHQYKGNERGSNFSTSGFRFIFGKGETKWTASVDYAGGGGKEKNQCDFKNGITQNLWLKWRNNQVNFTFGITKKDNKVWLEGLYCTNLGKIILEYSTEHLNGVWSYGTEYKLNGVYTSTIKTMEFGAQVSYKHKKYVFYARALMPTLVIGPSQGERAFVDARSSQADPKTFPSDYNSYLDDPAGHVSRKEYLQSTGMKGFSYGFGFFYLIGKSK